MKRKVLFCLATAAMVLVGCKERACKESACTEIECTEFLDNSSAVDLSDVAQIYDSYHSGGGFVVADKLAESKNKNLSKDMQVPMPEEGYFLFVGDTCMIRLPQYADSEHPFLSRAQDFYNSCAIVWNVWSNFELWYRFSSIDDEFEGDDIIGNIESIETGILTNDTLRNIGKWYKKKVAECMRTSGKDEDVYDGAYAARDSIMEVVAAHQYQFYDDEETFDSQINTVFSICYGLGNSRIERYNKASENERTGVALAELKACTNFDEQCSFLLLWSNNSHSLDDDEWIMAVAERLMQSGKYNPLLFDVWITWRSLCQSMYYGASRDSFIPNDYFNGYRRICYMSCLRRIEQHPDDIFAMNCASILAGKTNMNRFGDNMFGNEAMIEMVSSMPKRYEDILNRDGEEEEE